MFYLKIKIIYTSRVHAVVHIILCAGWICSLSLQFRGIRYTRDIEVCCKLCSDITFSAYNEVPSDQIHVKP
jgi:hypothetical protein